MKNLTKNEMKRTQGGFAERKLVKVSSFSGYAGNPCVYSKYTQYFYSDGTVETRSILGQLVESFKVD